jgi:DNA replication protein DnaC
MNPPTQDRASPFQKATTTDRRLKLFLWGDCGSGKTMLSLSILKQIMNDPEAGTKSSGGDPDIGVLGATATATDRGSK